VIGGHDGKDHDGMKESMFEMIKKHIMEHSYLSATDEIDMQEAINFIRGKLEEINNNNGGQGINIEDQIQVLEGYTNKEAFFEGLGLLFKTMEEMGLIGGHDHEGPGGSGQGGMPPRFDMANADQEMMKKLEPFLNQMGEAA
jgi:hypothetical protein